MPLENYSAYMRRLYDQQFYAILDGSTGFFSNLNCF